MSGRATGQGDAGLGRPYAVPRLLSPSRWALSYAPHSYPTGIEGLKPPLRRPPRTKARPPRRDVGVVRRHPGSVPAEIRMGCIPRLIRARPRAGRQTRRERREELAVVRLALQLVAELTSVGFGDRVERPPDDVGHGARVYKRSSRDIGMVTPRRTHPRTFGAALPPTPAPVSTSPGCLSRTWHHATGRPSRVRPMTGGRRLSRLAVRPVRPVHRVQPAAVPVATVCAPARAGGP